MKVTTTPEQALAVAVLERVVHEIRKGSPDRKRVACNDIRAGGCDVWVDVATDEWDVRERVRAELRALAGL